MSETQTVLHKLLKRFGPQSHYGLYHIARAKGYKFSPSGVRSRVSEMVRMKKVVSTDAFEMTPSGRKAQIWKAVYVVRWWAQHEGYRNGRFCKIITKGRYKGLAEVHLYGKLLPVQVRRVKLDSLAKVTNERTKRVATRSHVHGKRARKPRNKVG